jgi:hypothetical protein
MAATAKTTAMYEASQARYDRLVSFGAEKMAPESMKYILDKLQDMRKLATTPITPGDPANPAPQDELESMRETVVMQRYRELTPEVEKLEAKIRAVTPGGMPEEKLLVQPSIATSTFDLGKWTPWLILGGVALAGYFFLGRETSPNPRRNTRRKPRRRTRR